MAGTFSRLIDMRRKLRVGPRFGGVTERRRLLAGNIYNPGLFIVSNLCITTSSGSIVDGVFNTTFFEFFQAQKDTVSVKINLISDCIYGIAALFEKKNSCPGNDLRLKGTRSHNGFQTIVIFGGKY